MKKMNNKGFSLVELIVVIAIMAVLVGVLAPQFIKYVESSKQSTDMQNIEQMKTAVEVAFADGSASGEVKIKKSGTNAVIDPSTGIDSTKTTVALKHTTWEEFVYTFNKSGAENKWSIDHTSGTTSDHTKSIDTVFE